MSSNDIESCDDLGNLDEQRYASLSRLTGGIPQHELKTLLQEASDCEAALEKEIEILEAAVKGEGPILDDTKTASPLPPVAGIPREYDPTKTGPNYLSSAKDILTTDLTPLDRYFTVSSLIGRLREPLDTPSIPQVLSSEDVDIKTADTNTNDNAKKKATKSSNAVQQNRLKVLRIYKRIEMLKEENEIYTQVLTDNTALLALVKRISNHRTAAVFRRAVNPKEAPGYEERILFPVDMGLIKKLVVCGHINTFEKLHQYIGLICHNCVKFNGRYSDYALLTREFESYVDDSFLDFMQKQKDKATL